MAYIQKLFDKNFLEYASYVIKDRAIPYLEDGLKPVQRRVLHSLFEMDDGKFNKVANVVGNTMKYHPHGDASIYSSLVVLANKELFIDKQGNFGNIFTGDPASAARYIECRLTPMAKEVLYNPEITEYMPSYDGRNKEPLAFPAKFPIVIVQGTEGIAVGMSTKILPHNLIEVLEAMKSDLNGEEFSLVPDFPTGGLIDITDYDDGLGKVLVRAKVEVVDNKTVAIKELPFGSTTESLINSIDSASKKGKVMITHINDFSTENVEIELTIKRGFQAKQIVDALYAFTDCEKSISVNMLLIDKNRPVKLRTQNIIKKSTNQLQNILKAEIELEKSKLLANLHRRLLEKIFIVEKIYTSIEKKRTLETIKKAVIDGFKPFKKELISELVEENIEYLLRIPIRKISSYDIKKSKDEQDAIENRLKEIEKILSDILNYSLNWIDTIIEKYRDKFPRKTTIITMDQTSIKEAAIRDKILRYNGRNGYLGYELKEGPEKFKVSIYDQILTIDKLGKYTVTEVPEKTFVGRGNLHISLADKITTNNNIYTIIYRNSENVLYLKRFKIDKFILDRVYSIIPANSELMYFRKDKIDSILGGFNIDLVPVGKMRKLNIDILIKDYSVKGVGAKGYKVTDKEISKIVYNSLCSI